MKKISAPSIHNDIWLGRDFSSDVKSLLSDTYSRKNIILMTGAKSFSESGLKSQLLQTLSECGCEVIYEAIVSSNPSIDLIQAIMNELPPSNDCLILAVGGGSVLDAAKTLKHELKSSMDIFAIYTIAGSASLVSPFAVFDNFEFKIGIHGDELIPETVYISLGSIEGVPEVLLWSGVVDIFEHALESRLSKLSTDFSRECADKAIVYLMKYMSDRDVEDLIYADIYAGISERVGIVLVPHALGHFVTYTYGVSHGYANWLFEKRYIDILQNAGVAIPENYISLLNVLDEKVMQFLKLPQDIQKELTTDNYETIMKYMNFAVDNSPYSTSESIIKDIYRESIERVSHNLPN